MAVPPNAQSPLSATGSPRVTLRTLRQWMQAGEKFAMLTCYDASTARWLWRGGIRCLLVGDTAAEVILGHDSTLPAPLEFMLQITAAVRRGSPEAFVMADMPFGSYHCGDDLAMANACRFLTEGQADVVKLELDVSHAPLVKRMAAAGIPVVAHLGARPQQVRLRGGYGSAGRTAKEADAVVDAAKLMLDCGAAMLLVEAVPEEVSTRLAELALPAGVPVIGCGAGAACHGHVVVLHDLLGLSDWQPPFAAPVASLGSQVSQAAATFQQRVRAGEYPGHSTYRMR